MTDDLVKRLFSLAFELNADDSHEDIDPASALCYEAADALERLSQQQAEPVVIPSFIRRPIEEAIQTAHNPPPGSMVVGMPKAYVATDKLAYLLRMFDAGLYTAPPADDEAVRLLREARRILEHASPSPGWVPDFDDSCAAIDAYLAQRS